MKILVVMGSSKFGNTTEIVTFLEKQLNSLGRYDFEYLYLNDYLIDFCTGCHNCILIGEDKCSHYQKVKVIEDKMLEADMVILASPGYMFTVTGIMKNFLDHVAYNCHRPKYFGKKVFLLSSCTKWLAKSVFLPMKTWATGAGFSLIGEVFIEMMPFPLAENELEKKRKAIREEAEKIHAQLKNPKEIKSDLGGVIMFHVFRTLCKLAPNILKADYAYFNQLNAYDKNTKWYLPVKVSLKNHLFACNIERSMEKGIFKMMDKEKLKQKECGFRNKL